MGNCQIKSEPLQIMLLVFGCAVLFLTDAMPKQITNWLEIVVGLMLIVLGLDVIRRVFTDRVHFHTHRHGSEIVHFHAHSHKGENSPKHDLDSHNHTHKSNFPLRALFIGMIYGMAGSAALILLVLQTVSSAWLGMIYILLFGIGSMLGMALFSFALIVPLRATQNIAGFYNILLVVVGSLTVCVGTLHVL